MTETGLLKRWCFARPRDADAEGENAMRSLIQRLGLSPLVARLLVNRGFDQPEAAQAFLSPRLTDLHEPTLMAGVDAAARRIERAVRDRQPIVVYGDYDVDGVSASAILWHVLRHVGAEVRPYIPHRIDEGYGLNSEAIRQLAVDRPLIVTVDCGITAVEAAAVARELGVELIISDHHQLPADGLPKATLLVHPLLPHDDTGRPYPFDSLCGAGVAFKLAWHFARVHCGSDRLPQATRELLIDLLSLAALGTVADVVPLVGENRIITTFGLRQIKRTRFAGLHALIAAARLNDEKIDAFHVGFVLGPRLNACGRMGHAGDALRLLTDADEHEAGELAAFLTRENERRRETEHDIYEQAERMVADLGYDQPDCRAIVLGREGWHPGVVGIVASRLVERFHRPVVLLNFDNGEAAGSARSVDGVCIHAALTACAEHLTTYGGHAMAAGLRLATDAVEAFRMNLVEHINARLSVDELVGQVVIDAECGLGDLTVDLCEQVQQLAPFGRANPRPVLCLRRVRLARPASRIGRGGDHLRLLLEAPQHMLQAVGFHLGRLADELPAGLHVDVVFEPRLSFYRGYPRVDLHVKDLRPVS